MLAPLIWAFVGFAFGVLITGFLAARSYENGWTDAYAKVNRIQLRREIEDLAWRHA